MKQTARTGALDEIEVAPFTGAWIETVELAIYYLYSRVAPFTGAWIETMPGLYLPLAWCRRTLHGCVD